eukprot:11719-Heterococcus_DN1.PRE.1
MQLDASCCKEHNTALLPIAYEWQWRQEAVSAAAASEDQTLLSSNDIALNCAGSSLTFCCQYCATMPLVADSDWDLEAAETDTTETAEGGAESSVFNEDEAFVTSDEAEVLGLTDNLETPETSTATSPKATASTSTSSTSSSPVAQVLAALKAHKKGIAVGTAALAAAGGGAFVVANRGRPGGRRRIPPRTTASKKSKAKAPPKPEPYVAADFDFDLLNDEDADIYDAGTVLLTKH